MTNVYKVVSTMDQFRPRIFHDENDAREFASYMSNYFLWEIKVWKIIDMERTLIGVYSSKITKNSKLAVKA